MVMLAPEAILMDSEVRRKAWTANQGMLNSLWLSLQRKANGM
jgi:hypothetical protein